MNTMQRTFNELAEASSLLEGLTRPSDQTPISISQPIDVGADNLLRGYKNAWLTYPPLEVEYLIQTLNEHISNCLDIRLKAQELEAKAFSEASDQLLQRKLIETLMNQIAIYAENEPKLLGNSVNAKFNYDEKAISSEPSEYWQKVLNEQKAQLQIKLQDSNKRLEQLSESGSGNNYVQRFEFLKKTFEVDLIEAFCRARAASIGLKSIYEIDLPVPEITDIGYLDKLTLWARKATYELEKKFFLIREITVTFAINDGTVGTAAIAQPIFDAPRIMTLDAFRQARAGGNFTFNLSDNFFKRLNLNLKNPRLRGLDVHVVSTENKLPFEFWRVFVKPPVKRIAIGTGVQSYSYESAVFIPMATYIAHTSELNIVSNQREVNNVSPIGEWTIRIEPRSVLGIVETNNDYVDNLLIRMRLAYDKE